MTVLKKGDVRMEMFSLNWGTAYMFVTIELSENRDI